MSEPEKTEEEEQPLSFETFDQMMEYFADMTKQHERFLEAMQEFHESTSDLIEVVGLLVATKPPVVMERDGIPRCYYCGGIGVLESPSAHFEMCVWKQGIHGLASLDMDSIKNKYTATILRNIQIAKDINSGKVK